jgi:hypothetical protein
MTDSDTRHPCPEAAPDYANAMYNMALLLQRLERYAETV